MISRFLIIKNLPRRKSAHFTAGAGAVFILLLIMVSSATAKECGGMVRCDCGDTLIRQPEIPLQDIVCPKNYPFKYKFDS